MKKIEIQTTFRKMLADVYTPVGIYLRLRDRFRDTILLESTDFHAGENSYSFIGINAVAGIEICNATAVEFKLPGQTAERIKLDAKTDVPQLLWDFMQRFEVREAAVTPVNVAQGLFGYTSYDAVQFFDLTPTSYALSFAGTPEGEGSMGIPPMRYRLYQYVIAINHFKDELFICENHFNGIESEVAIIERKNVGYQLVHAAVEHARANHIKILPLCPFAKSVFDKKGAEFADVLKGN